MASRNIFLPKESNRRIPNGTYGGVRGMNNLYSIGRVAANSAECLARFKQQEAHPVTLTIYSSPPKAAIPSPLNLLNLLNPHAEGAPKGRGTL